MRRMMVVVDAVRAFIAGVRAWFELCYAVPPGC